MLIISSWPWWKWGAVVLVLAAFAVLAVLFVVTRVEMHQAEASAERLASSALQAGSVGRIAVVYFSRSGNTAVAAAHIAQRMRARLFRLEAPAYDVGLPGILRALHDARSHEAVIAPTTLDLRGFETVYLGSPIWLYSPSPPIWEFARRNRFDGKDVVLFNTFNSKFEQRFVDEFRQVVLAQGARSFRHLFVKRGRMGQQLTTGQMLDKIDAEWSLVEVVEQATSQNQWSQRPVMLNGCFVDSSSASRRTAPAAEPTSILDDRHQRLAADPPPHFKISPRHRYLTST